MRFIYHRPAYYLTGPQIAQISLSVNKVVKFIFSVSIVPLWLNISTFVKFIISSGIELKNISFGKSRNITAISIYDYHSLMESDYVILRFLIRYILFNHRATEITEQSVSKKGSAKV